MYISWLTYIHTYIKFPNIINTAMKHVSHTLLLFYLFYFTFFVFLFLTSNELTKMNNDLTYFLAETKKGKK